MSGYLRIYKNDKFQLTYQTYEANAFEQAKRDVLIRGGHLIREIGVVDDV